ncbi:MAG: hypothetical protein ILO53_05665 [Clostridia bacterium]|nr:hypothetical protein [Clostridia bacterium]
MTVPFCYRGENRDRGSEQKKTEPLPGQKTEKDRTAAGTTDRTAAGAKDRTAAGTKDRTKELLKQQNGKENLKRCPKSYLTT